MTKIVRLGILIPVILMIKYYKKIKGQNCRKAVTQSHGSQGRDSRAADSDGQEYSVRLLSLRKTISLGIVFFGPERGRRIKIENEKVKEFERSLNQNDIKF